jgi:8-oxo-dGTP diphosphatase
MGYRGRSEQEVDRRIRRLRDDWGSFPVERATVVNEPWFFEHGCEMLAEGAIGGGGAWISDDDGRVALVQHPDEPDSWGLPMGGHEPGETMAETARREVWEEAGLECELTGVAVAERKRFVHEEDPARREYLLSVVFEGRATGGELDLYPERWEADEELLDVRWHESAPTNVVGWFEELVEDWDWPDD